MKKRALSKCLSIFTSAVACIAFSLPTLGAPPTVYVDEIPPVRSQMISLRADTQMAENNEIWNRVFEQTWVRNVNSAALYPVFPPPNIANGKAVLVVPGGGYLFVSIENEGFSVAQQLAAKGYTAFVLKYRVNPSPADTQGFKERLFENFSQLGKKPLADFAPAVDDLALAVKTVQTQADEFQIDKDAISVIGFSAGARSLVRLLEQKPEAKLLQSVAFIYPPMGASVKGNTYPPMFFAMAVDDPLFTKDNLTFVESWLQKSSNVTVHLYADGGHGFGIKPKGTTSDTWSTNYLHWLQYHDNEQAQE